MNDKTSTTGLRDLPGIYSKSVTMELTEDAMSKLTKRVTKYVVYTSTNWINKHFPEENLPANYPCIIKF